MFRGLYTATNSMRTNAKKMDGIANNMANSQTTAFKKDVLLVDSFPEKLMVKLNGIEPNLRATRQQIKVDPPAENQEGGAVRLQITKGYLTMEDRQGKGYYQSALVKRDEEGYLRTVLRDSENNTLTKFGAYMLDRNGNRLQVNEGALNLTGAGVLQVGGVAVANIITPVNGRVIGTMNGGSWVDRTMINFNQGALEYTENPLNVAIQGQGFFKVLDRNDNTEKYSRQGAFTLSVDGLLVDHSGNPILSTAGGEINIPADSGQINIQKDGSIYRSENNQQVLIDTIQLVQVDNKEDMQKAGEAYLVATPGTTLNESEFQGQILQGYLEGSNVDTIAEMINMISALRSFEADQKVIRSYDDIMSKAANEIGKLT